MRRHLLQIIALKQPAERLQPQGRRVHRTWHVRSKEPAQDLLAQLSRMFFVPGSTALPKPIGETLKAPIESCCGESMNQFVRFHLHLDGSGLLEVVQSGFELTRAFGQTAGKKEGLSEATPSLLVLGILRQDLFQVGNRLIQEIPGFVGFTGMHQRSADLAFKHAEGGR